MFAWYGKCRRLQYCKTNIDIHNTVWILTRLEGYIVPVWHGLVALPCRCARYGRVRSSVLRFDLSVIPYLLRLIPRPSPSGHPRSVVPSRPRPCRSGKSCKQRSGVFSVRKGGRSQTISPPLPGLSGRRSDRSPGLSLGNWASPGGTCCRYAVCWAELLL